MSADNERPSGGIGAEAAHAAGAPPQPAVAAPARDLRPHVLGPRLAALLAARAAGARAVRGDHDLNPGMKPGLSLVPAAVLVPIVAHESGSTVLFTRRAAGLHAHSGEISFPGGRIEAGDRDPVAAALRETEEELGIAPPRIEVLGQLDAYVTRTGFRIAPVVGLLRPPLKLRLDPLEVAEAFEVPLSHLLDPANHQRRNMPAGRQRRVFYAIPYGPHLIWGATAGMLMNLCELLDGR